MLIRHAAYFQLLPVLDHPVSVILTTLVAALVPIVGLALSAPATRRLLAVRLPAITVVADDERPATPPTFDLSSLCAHRLTRGERRKFGRSNEPCDLSSRIARLKGPAPNPGPSSFCRSPRSALPGRRAQTPIPGGAVRSCPGPGDSGETGTQRERWRHSREHADSQRVVARFFVSIPLSRDRDASIRDGTHGGALGRLEVTFAFGALLWIDDVHLVFERNGGVWTLEFTRATNSALRSNDLV